jgi:hypothetical protein
LAVERANKQRDMSYAMKSMDCQLHASRNGALYERQQLDKKFETLKLKMKDQLDLTEKDRIESMHQLRDHYNTELKLKCDFYEVK